MGRFPIVLLLAASAACTPAVPDPRGIARGETLLTVGATRRADATPDQALFTAGLATVAPSAAAASARNAQVMARITAALAALKVPAGDIQTRELSVNRIDYGRQRGQYQTSNTVSVRVREIARVGAAIAAVTAAGANIVSGPNLSVADPERANLGAYAIAYKAARAKAQAYADAAGLRVVRTVTIRDGGEGGVMPMTADMVQMRVTPPPIVASPPPPVMPGTNTNVVSVSVDFALAPR